MGESIFALSGVGNSTDFVFLRSSVHPTWVSSIDFQRLRIDPGKGFSASESFHPLFGPIILISYA